MPLPDLPQNMAETHRVSSQLPLAPGWVALLPCCRGTCSGRDSTALQHAAPGPPATARRSLTRTAATKPAWDYRTGSRRRWAKVEGPRNGSKTWGQHAVFLISFRGHLLRRHQAGAAARSKHEKGPLGNPRLLFHRPFFLKSQTSCQLLWTSCVSPACPSQVCGMAK